MTAPLILARAVTRRFGSFTAVDEVSMEVHPGEVVGLLGANGAGKTTLMRMLLGLLTPSAGTVDLLGGPPDLQRRRRIGYVPQNLGLYADLTVRENLAFVSASYAAPMPEIPGDLAGRADVLVQDLPLGAQRQAAFVAATAHSPRALLLDEPTSGVDALARARLWDTIRDEAERGTAVLVTTHYMQEAQQCDRLLMMADGVLAAQGSETDIVGDTTALEVRASDWAAAFTALTAAGAPVVLTGQRIRVADGDPAQVRRILDGAGVPAELSSVPASIEERMVVLARAGTGHAGRGAE
ncbi:ABC transporter ATP-binding protein [Nocardioides insulae]|uniref:ABC transporter ATP-binding protein n=1 Tax=Nocardioides insulae TaxID=394734 RepID=UPI000421DD84|nr:ABC transporter ATP-binding protein [Nocardioides insulae]